MMIYPLLTLTLVTLPNWLCLLIMFSQEGARCILGSSQKQATPMAATSREMPLVVSPPFSSVFCCRRWVGRSGFSSSSISFIRQHFALCPSHSTFSRVWISGVPFECGTVSWRRTGVSSFFLCALGRFGALLCFPQLQYLYDPNAH